MALQHDSDSALAKAVRAMRSQPKFAALIGKSQSVVNDWLREDRPLPAEFVLTVEAATGISRHDLRPDIYPIESPAPVSPSDAGLPVGELAGGLARYFPASPPVTPGTAS